MAQRALIWPISGGFAVLGLTSGTTASFPWASNSDGSVIVGYCGTPDVPVRWDATTATQLSNIASVDQALYLSRDASIIEGWDGSLGGKFSRWTGGGVAGAHLTLPAGYTTANFSGSGRLSQAYPFRISSDDGTVIVGTCTGGSPAEIATAWINGVPVVLPGTDLADSTGAACCSEDGSVIVGDELQLAAFWTIGASGNDLLIGAANSVISGSHTFVSGDVFGVITITGGTGFTPGNYLITSVAGGAATLGASPGTLGSSGGVWQLTYPHLLINPAFVNLFCSADFCNAAGTIIYGSATDDDDVPLAVYWDSLSTNTGGKYGVFHVMDRLPGQDPTVQNRITACSETGSISVGWGYNSLADPTAIKWNGTTATALPHLSGGGTAVAFDCSGNGSVVVGYCFDAANVQQAVYWDAGNAIHLLPLPGGYGGSSTALGISRDGTLAWGISQSGSPPPTASVSVAELFFTQTNGFADPTSDANRRKFYAVNGGAQNLGLTGENPFGGSPQVFLTSNGTPSTFATNNGRGGPFIVLGGVLTASSTDPPGSSESVTTSGSAVVGQGVLGDYRNGNLYAFNPATYTDNGTPRKWVRRWRALPAGQFAAVRFFYLAVDMQTGVGVPDGANPQVVLRWSDDGGHSLGPERILSVGRSGQTAFTVKFNRLGATRRFSGSDRIFELSSTDQFKVAILDAEVEVS